MRVLIGCQAFWRININRGDIQWMLPFLAETASVLSRVECGFSENSVVRSSTIPFWFGGSHAMHWTMKPWQIIIKYLYIVKRWIFGVLWPYPSLPHKRNHRKFSFLCLIFFITDYYIYIYIDVREFTPFIVCFDGKLDTMLMPMYSLPANRNLLHENVVEFKRKNNDFMSSKHNPNNDLWFLFRIFFDNAPLYPKRSPSCKIKVNIDLVRNSCEKIQWNWCDVNRGDCDVRRIHEYTMVLLSVQFKCCF